MGREKKEGSREEKKGGSKHAKKNASPTSSVVDVQQTLSHQEKYWRAARCTKPCSAAVREAQTSIDSQNEAAGAKIFPLHSNDMTRQ